MCGYVFKLTNHGWDGSCSLLQLLDVKWDLLGWGHQHRALRGEQCQLFHREYSTRQNRQGFVSKPPYVTTTWDHENSDYAKTHLCPSGSASTSSSALQVALESLSELRSFCLSPWSPFSPLSLIPGSILTWTSPVFMSISWGSVLGCTEPAYGATLAFSSWDPVSLTGLFSSLTQSSPYEGSGAFPLLACILSWSEHRASPAVSSALLESLDFDESVWEGEGALSVSELLSPPERAWEDEEW